MRANGHLQSQGNEDECEEYAEQNLQFADSGTRDPHSGAPNTINSVVVEYLVSPSLPSPLFSRRIDFNLVSESLANI